MLSVEEQPLCTVICLRLEAAVRITEVKRTQSHLKELQACGEVLMQIHNTYTKLGTQS